jgi:hypothetical protein
MANATKSNQILIGNGTTTNFSYNEMEIMVNTSVGINKNPVYTLDVSGSVGGTAFYATSDYRIKDNISKFNTYNLIEKINPVYYFNKNKNKNDYGFIAHELQELFPELVDGTKDGENLQTINYLGIIPICINEIKKLRKEVEMIKIDIDYLKNK